MSKIQHYGIKFPFTTISDEKTLLDTNVSLEELVRSELVHVIFTPKGQRLRSPEFGTRLIQYIFNPNDNDTWGDVVCEVKDAVSRWVPRCQVNDIFVNETAGGVGLLVTVKYTVKGDDGESSEYIMSTTL